MCVIFDVIYFGELVKVEYENYGVFNLQVFKICFGVLDELLNFQNVWIVGVDSFKVEVIKFGGFFLENFKKYESEVMDDVRVVVLVV